MPGVPVKCIIYITGVPVDPGEEPGRGHPVQVPRQAAGQLS